MSRELKQASAMFFWLELATVAMLLSLVACTSQQSPKPLPVFERVVIETNDAIGGDLRANSTTEQRAKGVAGGFVGGAATGAVAGLACGPFAWFCSPIGALVGSFTGSVAGGVINGLDGLPGPIAKEVSEILARLDERRDFAAEVHSALVAAVPATRQTTSSDADARVLVTLERIDLRQYRHGRVALRMTASMKVTWDSAKSTPTTQTNAYEYETDEATADEWIFNNGERFDAGMTLCIDRVSQRMARDLALGSP